MKRIALFSALVALLCWQSRSVLAQEVYHTFLEEGKVWTYLHYNDRTGKRYQFTRVIDGDTVIGGLTYKKILDKVGGQYQYALREEGKKVYIVDGHYETESLLYDFNKDVGDYLFLKETGAGDGTMQGWKVASVDTISIGCVRFRRMKIIEYNSFYGDSEWWGGYWIEGIGSECLLESSFRLIGNYDDLISCQINGQIYTQQELLATGIDGVKTEKSKQKGQNSSVFNLYGQRINGLQKGLNIVDGKKMWVR